MPLCCGHIAVSSHAVGLWKEEAKEGILTHLLLFLLSIQYSKVVSERAQERISAMRVRGHTVQAICIPLRGGEL